MKKTIIRSVEDVDMYVSKNCEGQKHIHDYKVNESGLIECFDCRLPIINNRGLKNVKEILRKQYGKLWKEKFKQLMEIQKMVLKEETAGLKVTIHGYEDNEHKLNIGRIFYEK